MLMTKVSFAALCCFIAHTIKCSAAQQEVTAAQVVAEERTMLQEMLILSGLLNVSPFVRTNQNVKPILYTDDMNELIIHAIISELMVLKSMIDTEQSVFKSKDRTADVPDYKGEKRYLCVRGLLNSMAQKFEELKEFLLTASKESNEFKQKLVALKIGTDADISDDLTLRQVRAFYKMFYDENAPIPHLRELFNQYEQSQVDIPDRTKTHPFAAFIKESDGNGVELSTIDQSNVKKVVSSRSDKLPPLPIVDTVQRGPVEENLDNTSDTHAKKTVQENENVNTGETNVESTSSQQRQLVTEETGAEEESQEPNRSPTLPAVEDRQQSASRTPLAPAVSSSHPASPSLRTETAETTPKKASSALDSFVSLLLVVSAVFAL